MEAIEKVFDLIAEKAFTELTSEEKAFVLQHITEDEYEFQRRIIAETASLEYPDVQPSPLVLPSTSKPFLSRSIPLYQVFIGAACLTVGFFLFRKENVRNVLQPQLDFSWNEFEPVVQITHDTVIKMIPVQSAVSVSRQLVSQINDTIYIVQSIPIEMNNRMLDASVPSINIQLSDALVQPKGRSAKDDKTTSLLPKTAMFSSLK